MKYSRDKQLDAIRGFAIILVVMGHVVAFTRPDTFTQSVFFNLIYSFHIPLFFFISGFLVFGRFGPTFIGWTKKKFMQLIVPYILFTLFYFFILFSPPLSSITPARIVQVLFSYTVPDSAWFLPVLFESLVILALCIEGERIIGKYSYGIFFLLFSLVIPLVNLNSISAVQQIVFYTPFTMIGYLACEYKDRFSGKVLYMEVAGLILFLMLFAFKYLMLLPSVNSGLFYLYYDYILAMAGIAVSWMFIKLTTQCKVVYYFITYGIFSIEIYLIHLIIINYFTFRGWPLWIGTGIVAIVTGTIVILTLSLAAALALSWNKRISTILFGRWSFKYFRALFQGC